LVRVAGFENERLADIAAAQMKKLATYLPHLQPSPE
jgi:hypothetical protein